MYEKARKLLLEEQPAIYALGPQHPDYQKALIAIVDRLTRTNQEAWEAADRRRLARNQESGNQEV